jgi:hypothetical protein
MSNLNITILSQKTIQDSFHGLTIQFKGLYNNKHFIAEYVPCEGMLSTNTLHENEEDILAHNFTYDHTTQTVRVGNKYE